MNAERFISVFEREIRNNKESFITNMNNEGEEDHTFCHWIEIFSGWMEWNHGDCEEAYGDDYEEEE